MPLNGFEPTKEKETKKKPQVEDSAKRVGYRDSAGFYHAEMYIVEVDEETGVAILPHDEEWED